MKDAHFIGKRRSRKSWGRGGRHEAGVALALRVQGIFPPHPDPLPRNTGGEGNDNCRRVRRRHRPEGGDLPF